jgi:hypothetical protein
LIGLALPNARARLMVAGAMMANRADIQKLSRQLAASVKQPQK